MKMTVPSPESVQVYPFDLRYSQEHNNTNQQTCILINIGKYTENFEMYG